MAEIESIDPLRDEVDSERFVTDHPIERQTLPHFVEACVSGNMPGGVKTNLPLAPFEVFSDKWARNYSEWAPHPQKSLKGSMNDRVWTVLGSTDDPTHLAILERRLDFMKARIWEGMAPMCETRWKSRDLDNPENLTDAIQHISLILSVFSYLHEPKVQGNMREVFNLVHNEVDIFQTAINKLRVEKGESPLNLTGLWEEFIQATFGYIARQARSYVFTHLKRLRKIQKDCLLAAVASGRVISSTHGTVKIDHLAKARFIKLVDLTKRANVIISIPITGFKNLHSFPSEISLTEEASNEKFSRLWVEFENNIERTFVGQLDRRTRDREAQQRFPYFLEELLVAFEREFALNDLQPETGEPAPLQPESWVQDIKDREKVKRFGFVAYRISYTESDEEWAEIMSKLAKGMNVWDDVVGGADIKGKAVIHWINGKEEGISEGDVNATRSHFEAFSKSSDFPPNLNSEIYLAIDPTSARSFKHPQLPMPVIELGGFRGHILAIDVNFESEDDNHGDVKGYNGQLRVIDQLIWTDLYAMLARQCQFLDFMWKIAEQDPWRIYTGVKIRDCKIKHRH